MRPTAVGSQLRSSTASSSLAGGPVHAKGSVNLCGTLDGSHGSDLGSGVGEIGACSPLVSWFTPVDCAVIPRVRTDLVRNCLVDCKG